MSRLDSVALLLRRCTRDPRTRFLVSSLAERNHIKLLYYALAFAVENTRIASASCSPIRPPFSIRASDQVLPRPHCCAQTTRLGARHYPLPAFLLTHVYLNTGVRKYTPFWLQNCLQKHHDHAILDLAPNATIAFQSSLYHREYPRASLTMLFDSEHS